MGFKLSPHAFTRFWDVHAWAGVLGGLVLYVIFLAGSITLFQRQLATWEEPLAQRPSAASTTLQATLDHGLTGAGPTTEDIWFYPPGKDHGAARLVYQPSGSAETKAVWIDPQTQALVPERERLSSFLYALHFLWHDLTGDWLYYTAGLLAVALSLALVTGVLIHVKDIVRQFHQFRPNKSRRVLWSDLHKVLGVMGLPFQLMYAFTGAFIVLGPFVLRAFTGPVFAGNAQRAAAVAWGASEETAAKPGTPTRGLTADALLARARSAVPTLSPEVIRLVHHGHDNGTFEVRGSAGGALAGSAEVVVRETDGAILRAQTPGNEGSYGATRRWLLGLHYAQFGGLRLRFLFFVLGLATAATILTGNWVWLARREARRSSMGNRLLARLTAGVGAGTIVAIAALFLASRLFPLGWAVRGTAEELTFVAVLALCIAWSLAARDERALWRNQLAAAGAMLLPVPILAARWSGAGLFGRGPRIAAVVGVDIALLIVAVSLGFATVALRRLTGRAVRGSHEADGSLPTGLAVVRDPCQLRKGR